MSQRRNKRIRSKEKEKERHIMNNGAFFNKGKKYKSGIFYSKKNHKTVKYRSAYEYQYFQNLEENTSVINYTPEPFAVDYVDADGIKKSYIPDVMILYADGKIAVHEVKPKSAHNAKNVTAKARAIQRALKMTGREIEYKMVSEETIFKNAKHYQEVLEKLSSRK